MSARRHDRAGHGTAALTCGDSAACQSALGRPRRLRHRRVSETPLRPARPTPTSVQRTDAADNDNNAGDFAAGADARRRERGGGDERRRRGDPGPLRSTTSRASSWLPPNGKQVTNVPGIVTASGPRAAAGVLDPGPATGHQPGHQRGPLRLHLVAGGGGRRLASPCRARSTTSTPVGGDSVETTSNLSVTESAARRVIVPSHGNACRRRGRRAHHGARAYAPDLGAATSRRRRSTRPASASTSGVARGHARARSTTLAWSGRRTISASSTSPTKPARPRRTAAAPSCSAENTITPGRVERRTRQRQQSRRSTSATCSPVRPRAGRLLAVRRIH